MSFLAERCDAQSMFHVVRTSGRYGCGSKRFEDRVYAVQNAAEVPSNRRCQRVGCQNDYDKADAEARSARKVTGAVTVEQWNGRYPEGTPVTVKRDNGAMLTTKTRSHAWQLGDGTPVVLVEGISGGYLLDRVTPVPPSPEAP